MNCSKQPSERRSSSANPAGEWPWYREQVDDLCDLAVSRRWSRRPTRSNPTEFTIPALVPKTRRLLIIEQSTATGPVRFLRRDLGLPLGRTVQSVEHALLPLSFALELRPRHPELRAQTGGCSSSRRSTRLGSAPTASQLDIWPMFDASSESDVALSFRVDGVGIPIGCLLLAYPSCAVLKPEPMAIRESRRASLKGRGRE